MQNSDFKTRLTSLYWSHTSSVVLRTHNSMLSTRIKRLYGFQHSRVVLCIQISDFSTWITSLYWSQPSSVVFAFKTETFGPAYKSLWVPDITCRFVHEKPRDQHLNYLSLCVPALISGFCMQNSAFWTRITSLHRSQTKSVLLSTHNWVLSTRIKGLYWFQPSPVVLCMQISDFSTWITSLYWSQPSSVVFACKTATFGPAYKSLWVPDLTCGFVHTKKLD